MLERGSPVLVEFHPGEDYQYINRALNSLSHYGYVLNEKTCLQCNLCKEVCPNLSTPIFQKPIKVFAGWSNNIDVFESAASGGIATELYLDALAHNMFVAGVKLTSGFKCKFELTNESEQIGFFKNSKYTFSNIGEVYNKIIEIVQNGYNVLFIGMPCQVAAVKKNVTLKRCADRLILVDLAGHGLPAEPYFEQHIKWIEEKNEKKAEKCFFRDPEYDTKRYAMTVYEKRKLEQEEKPFYRRYVNENDLYQIGYHSSIIYRENIKIVKFMKKQLKLLLGILRKQI